MPAPSAGTCAWAAGSDALYLAYHDTEWGVPLRDERGMFEMLTLEGAQAGLAWATILRKREGYRRAFAGFDPELVAQYAGPDRNRLLADAGIVRNRAKVAATIGNARAVLDLWAGGTTLVDHLWSFVDGVPVVNRFASLAEIPAETPLSRAMSKDLRGRGFRFVGPTICYALMQATGIVNDHETGCERWAAVQVQGIRRGA
jgi:DNA-3-methyladenine glycosylase I